MSKSKEVVVRYEAAPLKLKRFVDTEALESVNRCASTNVLTIQLGQLGKAAQIAQLERKGFRVTNGEV